MQRFGGNAWRFVRTALLFAIAVLGADSTCAQETAASSASSAEQGCELGSSTGLSTDEAAARLAKCAGARGALLRPSIDMGTPAGVGTRQPLGRPTRASAGEATAVVATTCPSGLGSPCFDDPSRSIQEAIDAMVAAHPDKARTILISPGHYTQSFETAHGWNGETHIVGVGSAGTLSAGSVSIEAPADGVASTAWRLGGRGSVSALSFKMGEDAGDRGIAIGGIIAVELYFDNVTLLGNLGPGARGIDVTDITGFLTLQDSRVLLNCQGGDGESAAVWVNQPQRAFTEITIHGGHYQVFSTVAPAGCATFELEASPFGDDADGIGVEFVHLQCEASSTCFEINGDNVHLDVGPLVFRRSPGGQFMRVKGAGSSSQVFLHGLTREAGTIHSEWGNVVPKGTMTITGAGEPTMPTFPGWTYKREDGGPGQSTYVGEGSPGPPYTWRAVSTN